MSCYQNKGQKLFYQVKPCKVDKKYPETIVFAHGSGGNSLSWSNQLEAFSNHYQCIVFDHRGFGRSHSQLPIVRVSDFKEDLLFLMDHLDLGRVNLVGQSMGGYTSLRFACDFPDRVQSLVLSSSNGLIDHGSNKILLPAFHKIEGFKKIGKEWGWSKYSEERTGLIERYNEIRKNNSDINNGIVIFKKTEDDLLSLQRLKSVSCRTLVIGGEEDPLFPPSLLRECSKLFSNGHCKILKDVGHSPYIEAPEKFNNELRLHFESK